MDTAHIAPNRSTASIEWLLIITYIYIVIHIYIYILLHHYSIFHYIIVYQIIKSLICIPLDPNTALDDTANPLNQRPFILAFRSYGWIIGYHHISLCPIISLSPTKCLFSITVSVISYHLVSVYLIHIIYLYIWLYIMYIYIYIHTSYNYTSYMIIFTHYHKIMVSLCFVHQSMILWMVSKSCTSR